MGEIDRNSLEKKDPQAGPDLFETDERMRWVVNHVPEGIITINEHGKVTNFNSAAARIFSYSADEVIGQNIKMLMPEPYHSEHDGYIANYIRTGQAKIVGVDLEAVGRRKSTAHAILLVLFGTSLSAHWPRRPFENLRRDFEK